MEQVRPPGALRNKFSHNDSIPSAISFPRERSNSRKQASSSFHFSRTVSSTISSAGVRDVRSSYILHASRRRARPRSGSVGRRRRRSSRPYRFRPYGPSGAGPRHHSARAATRTGVTVIENYVDPIREQYDAFRALAREGPVHMLNLVRFRERSKDR